jgi:hypothetical protein
MATRTTTPVACFMDKVLLVVVEAEKQSGCCEACGRTTYRKGKPISRLQQDPLVLA